MATKYISTTPSVIDDARCPICGEPVTDPLAAAELEMTVSFFEVGGATYITGLGAPSYLVHHWCLPPFVLPYTTD